MQYQTAITTVDARLHIQASGFWGVRSERVFFNVKVFNPLAKSYNDKPLSFVSYDQRVREVEFGNFTPLIFSAATVTGSFWLHSSPKNGLKPTLVSLAG